MTRIPNPRIPKPSKRAADFYEVLNLRYGPRVFPNPGVLAKIGQTDPNPETDRTSGVSTTNARKRYLMHASPSNQEVWS